MSTISVSNIETANGSEPLTIKTGNTSNQTRLVFNAANGITFYVNSSANAAYTVANDNIFYIPHKLELGDHTAGGFDFGNLAIIEIDQNQNTYLQIVVQNANTGNNASADLIVTNDQGNDTVNFVDLGINGSGYDQAAFNIGGAGDAYLYASNGALAIGTAATGKDLVFHTNGTINTSEKMRVGANGRVIVNGVMNVVTNTFTLGSSTNAATGFTILPNQIKMNWGVVVPNSVGSNTATFSSAFTTNAYTVSLSIRASVANVGAANAKSATFSVVNNSTIVINVANNTVGVNTGVLGVHYLAIGPA